MIYGGRLVRDPSLNKHFDFQLYLSYALSGGSPLRRILVHPPKNLSKNQNCSKKSTQESEIYARIQKVRKNHGKNQESTQESQFHAESTQESQFHAESTQESWFFTRIYATDEVK